MLGAVRKKQYDFHNHIQAILSMCYTTNTYEKLVEQQMKYMNMVMQENVDYKLLNSQWSLIAGFLYSKIREAMQKNIVVRYHVESIKKIDRIQEPVVIEMRGIIFIGLIFGNANLYIEFIYYNFIFVMKFYVLFLLAVWYDFPIKYFVFLKVHKRTIHNETGKGSHMADKVRTDVLLKDFWRVNERFADLFNAVIFQGKEVLKAEELQERDTDMSGIIRFREHEESLVRVRDVVKKTAFGVEFVVLGIESQQKIHYAMPLRTMLYDGMGYLKEYREITQTMKKEKGKWTEEEFLSGMRKEDRLHPIITIVIYYLEYVWDGPMCLKNMIVEMPEEIEKIFSDYKMNLIQVRDSGQYIFHNDDVRTVFEISREIFRGNFEEINRKYKDRDIKQELIRVIGKITDSSKLMDQKTKGEKGNMCTALRKLEEECEQKGRKEGLKEGISSMVSVMRELQIEPEVILQKLQEKFQLTREEAERFLDI